MEEKGKVFSRTPTGFLPMDFDDDNEYGKFNLCV